jgi:hypothetical protein
MEEKIDKLFVTLKIEYAFLWIASLALIPLYEYGFLQEGIYAGNERMNYILYTIGIILAIVLIPLALKLFSLSLVKRISKLSINEAIQSYKKWSEIRLGLIFIPAIINLSFYYMTLNTTGIFCASMALVASLFCVPDKQKILKELNIEE